MTWRKRLRIIWAAVTQDWYQETCDDCSASWWSDRRNIPSAGWCMDCEGRHFDKWKKEDDARRNNTKEVA